jgi:hypothetical protein
MSENELAKKVIEYFESNGYEIYKEVVNTGKGKNRADIIAVKDDEYTVIETKVSFGLTVIEQGFKWKPFSHHVYCCMPRAKRRHGRKFGYDMCRDYGIGVIEVDKYGNVHIVHESSKTNDPELPQLYEEQKEQDAGTTGNQYVTPFKITCKKLVEHIQENGEMPLLTAIKSIEHHYKTDASAKNALNKMIKIGVIPELDVYKEGRTTIVRLYKPRFLE